MSPRYRLVSCCLVLHLTAIALGSVPPPTSIPTVEPARATPTDPLARLLTPFLDRSAVTLSRVPAAVWGVARAPIRVARLYLRTIGLGQQWNMFWQPPRQDQYVRLRYYVQNRGARAAPLWTATELVYPAHREDQVRLVASYWDKHRDKAIFAALDGFLRRRAASLRRQDTRPEELPDDLAPILRHFTATFARTHLARTEQVVRAELWFGVADVPPRGTVMNARTQRERDERLRAYYEGPQEEHSQRTVYPPYYSRQREADILWLLEYYEEP